MKHAFLARVRGRIQGVGYRTYVMGCARRLELGGWIRTLPDGSFELHAEGEERALDELRRALAASTSYARDPEVELERVPPEALEAFELRP